MREKTSKKHQTRHQHANALQQRTRVHRKSVLKKPTSIRQLKKNRFNNRKKLEKAHLNFSKLSN